METLARLTPYSVTPISRLLRVAATDLPWGATLLLISAIAPEGTRAALLRQREHGRDGAWLYLCEDSPPTVPGVLVRHAPSRADWRRDAPAPQMKQAMNISIPLQNDRAYRMLPIRTGMRTGQSLCKDWCSTSCLDKGNSPAFCDAVC